MAYKISSTTVITDDTSFNSVGILTATSFSGKGSIPSGTVMIFPQASAPTGFTKITTHNDKALRVVSGTGGGSGGSVAFTTVHVDQPLTFTQTGSSGDTTLTTPQIASHAHPASVLVPLVNRAFRGAPGTRTLAGSLGNEGGSGSHSHPPGSFPASPVDLRVLYVDAIIASRDA